MKKSKTLLMLIPLLALTLSGCRETPATSSSESPTSSSEPSSSEPSSSESSSQTPSSSESSSETPSSSEESSSEAPSSSESSSETPSSSEESSSEPSSSESSSDTPSSSEESSSEEQSSSESSSEIPSSSEESSSEEQSSSESSSETPSSSEESSSECSSESSSEQSSSSESSSSESSSEVTDELKEMNDAIKDRSFVDPFEVRDYLIEKGYDFYKDLGSGKKYGYSMAHLKVVIYQNSQVIAPESCVNDKFVSFASVIATSYDELRSYIVALNSGTATYSTIKLGANVTQTESSELIQSTSATPLEIDLNGYSILAPNAVNKDYKTEKWFTLQFMDKTNSSNIYVHSGTIEANRAPKEDGVEDDACALSLAGGGSFRISHLALNAKNGTQCIGDYSQYINNNGIDQYKKIYIDNVEMNAPLRALTIAGGDWSITGSTINGMVIIDGGKVVINKCIVDASTCVIEGMNEYQKGYTNTELASLPVTKLNGKAVNTNVITVLKNYPGAITFNDAINVVSRRFAAYNPANVTVRNSSLKPVVVNNVVTGYGFRYWDVAGYTSKDAVNPTLENNVYPLEDGSGFGGSNFSE